MELGLSRVLAAVFRSSQIAQLQDVTSCCSRIVSTGDTHFFVHRSLQDGRELSLPYAGSQLPPRLGNQILVLDRKALNR
jgi:hypothetical protein